MKTLLYRLIAVLLGFAVALSLAEIAVRLISPQETGPPRFAFHPELGEIPVLLQRARRLWPGVYDFTYSNNSQGFRGSREYGPKKPEELRLLLLGDSFTYGLGVNDDQTFGAQLEQCLRQNRVPAEVVNAGCPGKGTDYELKLFQTLGAGLQPDVTVLCFFANDFQDNSRGEYYDVAPDGGLRARPLDRSREGLKTCLFNLPAYNWLISRSQAANLVKQAAVDYLVKRQQELGAKATAASGLVVSYTNKDGGYSDEANRKLTGIYLQHLTAAVRQAGSELLVCYIPLITEVEAYRRTREISRDEAALKELTAARGGELLSLTPVLSADPRPLKELYCADGHWTAQAHLLAGRYMAEYLDNFLRLHGSGRKN